MLIQNSTSSAAPPQLTRVASEGPSVIATEIQTPAIVVAPQPQEKPVPVAQLQSAVESTNKAMQASKRDLAFSIDSDTKQTIVKLMDSKTGDVIGQFPSHQMLEISKAIGLMQEQLQQASITKAPVQSTQGMLIKQLA